MNALLRELNSGASGLRGTVADGIVRVAEADINNVLATTPAAAAGLKVEIHDDNRILARYGVLHATVVLPPRSDLSQSPELTFALGSVAVAWALKAVLKQPYVRIHGRHVTVDLAGVPALAPYRHLLRHVRQIELTTTAPILTVRFHVAIG
jgi:hypothetical protein